MRATAIIKIASTAEFFSSSGIGAYGRSVVVDREMKIELCSEVSE